MSLAGITQALSQGYGISKVIKSVLRMNTPLAKNIQQALNQGYSEDEIGKYLTNQNKRSYSQKKTELSDMTEEEKARGILYHQPESEKKLGGVIKNATIAVPAAVAGGLAAPMATAALQRALPTGLSSLIPALTRQGQGQTQQQQPPSQPPVNQVEPTIPQNTQPIQPQGISKSKEELEKMGILDQVKSSLSRGNTPEQVSAEIGIKKSGKSKIDPELTGLIDSFVKEGGDKLSPTLQGQENVSTTVPTEKVEDVIEPVKIEKGSKVISSKGVGNVIDIRGDNAAIDIDGKKVKVPLNELDSPLFSDDEIADSYDDLMSKIPEEHRSGFIQWAGYDEDRNVLGFIPRGGKYEELENISPMEAHIIKEGVGTARTTGKNREGLWVVGEDTRGGLISQIIHDRRKKRQSGEEKQGKFDFSLEKPEKQDRGMKTLFDELEFPRNLSRERDKKKKLEDKEKKKKEKDEAKKRKK